MHKIISLFLLAVFAFPTLATPQGKRQASLVLINGKIFVSDENYTVAEAVAIDGERIVAVGTTNDIKARFQSTKTIDLGGKLVTPGFNDAHVHFFRGALALLTVVLTDAPTLEAAKQKVAAKVRTVKPGEWITGRGWDHTLWGGNFPTRADLDAVAPDNPVYLVRVDGHVTWANSAALRLAKIDKNTPNPEGGEIVRDANGEATGILKETAGGLVGGLVPEPNEAQRRAALESALREAARYGITSIQDNSGYETTKLYREFLQADKLTVRVAEWQNFEDSVETLKRQRAEFASFKDDSNRMKLTALKGYVDGTLGSKTAAMLAPFQDDAKNSGIPRRQPEELTKMVLERDREGWQIALHAIGDRANRMALESFAAAKKKSDESRSENKKIVGATSVFTTYDPQVLRSGEFTFKDAYKRLAEDARHRIEHAQVVAPEDFKRFRELGVIASMQPTHAISDKRWAESRLGEYRVLGAYSWHTFRSHGVSLPLGTDFPVEPINPYLTLYAAATRQSADGEPFGGWFPQERLSVMEAIRCHTFESAYAEFAETEKGQIKAGMLADLVVHSQDLTRIDAKQILQTEPLYTIFNGKIVYQKMQGAR